MSNIALFPKYCIIILGLLFKTTTGGFVAKRNVGDKPKVQYRVAKFFATQHGEVLPASAEAVLLHVSAVLTRLYNSALLGRQQAFDTHVAPLLLSLRAVKLTGSKEDEAQIRLNLKEAFSMMPTLFDQINDLTGARANDPEFACTPRNWQEETLDALDGAFKSFIALRKNGDYDAKHPKDRRESEFCAIPGRSGFTIKGDQFFLNCPKIGIGKPLAFTVPSYQLGLIASAHRVKKFTLTREPRSLALPGKYWISIAYEISMPETTFADVNKLVYLKSGASAIGVVSSAGYEVIEFERPDKFWQPKIDSAQSRLGDTIKGSKAHTRRRGAMNRMFNVRSTQAKLNVRTIVQRLIRDHGIHFVVDDVVVRSKKGKLADSSKAERGGTLGLNWSAQNTGSYARFLSHLEEKVKERGGSVRRFPLRLDSAPNRIGARGKIDLALALKKAYLASLMVGVVE